MTGNRARRGLHVKVRDSDFRRPYSVRCDRADFNLVELSEANLCRLDIHFDADLIEWSHRANLRDDRPSN